MTSTLFSIFIITESDSNINRTTFGDKDISNPFVLCNVIRLNTGCQRKKCSNGARKGQR